MDERAVTRMLEGEEIPESVYLRIEESSGRVAVLILPLVAAETAIAKAGERHLSAEIILASTAREILLGTPFHHRLGMPSALIIDDRDMEPSSDVIVGHLDRRESLMEVVCKLDRLPEPVEHPVYLPRKVRDWEISNGHGRPGKNSPKRPHGNPRRKYKS